MLATNLPMQTPFSDDNQPGHKISWPWLKWVQDVTTSALQFTAHPPATAAAKGAAGQLAFDKNFLYVAVSKNTWKRVALSSW